jgi:hypothetical protein
MRPDAEGNTMTDYAVISMIKPELMELEQFVRHHLAAGASEMILMHDGSTDHLVREGFDPEAWARQGVTLVAMDDRFWADNLGYVPDTFRERRSFATGFARNLCTKEWFLFVDEDEFLIDRIKIRDILPLLPRNVDAVLIRVAEAVWGPGEPLGEAYRSTWFRRPFPNRQRWKKHRSRTHGLFWPFFLKGLTGYVHGKQLVRNTAVFESVNAHTCIRYGVNVTVPIGNIDERFDQLEIALFDAISYARWKRKMDARHEDVSFKDISRIHRSRQTQFASVYFRGRPRLQRALFKGLYSVKQKHIEAGRAMNIYFQFRVHPGT